MATVFSDFHHRCSLQMVYDAGLWQKPVAASWSTLQVGGKIYSKFQAQYLKKGCKMPPLFQAQYHKVIRTCGAHDFAALFRTHEVLPRVAQPWGFARRLRLLGADRCCGPGAVLATPWVAPFADSIGAMEEAEILSGKWPGEPAR